MWQSLVTIHHSNLKGDNMPLKIEYGKRGGQVLGTITSGYSDGSTTVRDSGGRVLGHSSERFNTTRDSSGKLVSTNTASPELLIRKK
jgi:hypothetical protein